jgi:hypothetical protein
VDSIGRSDSSLLLRLVIMSVAVLDSCAVLEIHHQALLSAASIILTANLSILDVFQ